MPRIAPVNLSDLPPEAQAAVDEHLRQGYRLTNEKLTLLHNVTAFKEVITWLFIRLCMNWSETPRWSV